MHRRAGEIMAQRTALIGNSNRAENLFGRTLTQNEIFREKEEKHEKAFLSRSRRFR